MKQPSEWVDEMTRDRPDDFAPDEFGPMLTFVARVQIDARRDLLEKINRVRTSAKAWMNDPGAVSERARLVAAIMGLES